jgi:hypothetical protein
MRTSVLLLAISALPSCQRAEPNDGFETEQERIEKQYKTWAARQPRPPALLVDQIEALLAQAPCIGSMDRWSRFYGYNRLPDETAYTGIVNFHLEEAGAVGVKAGRHITEPESWLKAADDRPIKMVWGDYDLKDNRIRVAFCGNNVGGRGGDATDNIRTYYDELKRRRPPHGT